MKECILCGSKEELTQHHIIHQEDNKNLRKCKYNKVWMCKKDHRYVHSKKGRKLNEELELLFQNSLEILFIKKEFTIEEVKDTLEITQRATERLLEPFKSKKGYYSREDIIKACMGLKIKE